MSNGRIWLVHTETGERKLLFKHYPAERGYMYDPQALEDWINEKLLSVAELDADPRFTLATDDTQSNNPA